MLSKSLELNFCLISSMRSETTLSFNEDEPTVINKNKTNRLLTANFSKSVITLSNLKALVNV